LLCTLKRFFKILGNDTNDFVLHQDEQLVEPVKTESKHHSAISNERKTKKVKIAKENCVAHKSTERDVAIGNATNRNRNDNVKVAVCTMQKRTIQTNKHNTCKTSSSQMVPNVPDDSSEEETDVEPPVIGYKTDPNGRIDSENEDDTEDSDYETSDESEEEEENADISEIQLMEMAKKRFERKYMLSVTELKMRKGFYDVPSVSHRGHTIIEAEEYEENTEQCMICMEEFEEGDEVAVNKACDKPHCLHINCYFNYIKNIAVRDTRACAAGPNLLMKIKGCLICTDKYSPYWYEWEYCSTPTKNWKKGRKLPNNDVQVYGIHHYDDGNIKFSHFITDYDLFIEIQNYMYFMMTNRRLKKSLLGNHFYGYNKYEMYMTRQLTCHECNLKMCFWKAVYLRECNKRCKYRICRDCFIKCIVAKHYNKNSYRKSGILPCPDCKTSSKAQFMLTKEPCSHEYRIMLQKWDLDE
jgi:hypothetical protein